MKKDLLELTPDHLRDILRQGFAMVKGRDGKMHRITEKEIRVPQETIDALVRAAKEGKL